MEVSPDIFDNTEIAYADKSNAQLSRAQTLFQLMNNSALVNLGTAAANIALALHLPVSPLFRYTVYNHFCGGETFRECKKTIEKLAERNVGVLLNYGVELKEDAEDFDKAVVKNQEAVEFAGSNKSVAGVCLKPTGFGRMELFEKIQINETLTEEENVEYLRVKERFESLCRSAVKHNVALYIDAEESWIQNTLDALVEALMQTYNKEKCLIFNTFQMYRTDRLSYLREEIEKARNGGYCLGAKLVRGAYMEKERERATEKGYPSPIHKNKDDVDRDFDAAVALCLDNLDHVSLCIASQSESSNLLAIEQIAKRNIDLRSPRITFSQLYGMGDNITFNLAALGLNATKYLPYGPVKEVIPYLIRRAQENTSVSGQMSRELALLNKEIKRRRS